MDWSTFIPSMIGAAVPVCVFAFWLGGLAQSLKSLKESMTSAIDTIHEQCDRRATDHCHHYERINKHEVKIGTIDTRVTSLEQWRARYEE